MKKSCLLLPLILLLNASDAPGIAIIDGETRKTETDTLYTRIAGIPANEPNLTELTKFSFDGAALDDIIEESGVVGFTHTGAVTKDLNTKIKVVLIV